MEVPLDLTYSKLATPETKKKLTATTALKMESRRKAPAYPKSSKTQKLDFTSTLRDGFDASCAHRTHMRLDFLLQN